MDWPKCRLCEEKHDPKGEHVFPDVVEKTSKGSVVGFMKTPVESKKGLGFDRVGYQREYMKVWRALRTHRADPWPKEA